MAELKRNPFLNTNRYQRRIILSVMTPSMIACGVCLFTMIYMHYISSHIIFYSHVDFNRPEIYIPWFLDLNRFAMIIPWILLMIAFLMVTVIAWSFDFSNKLLGPYERVIRELDDVIAGKGKKQITFRSGDEMFIELFRRVNTLIEKLPS